MPLTPGTKLGPYEVLAALGAGGMGEVYRARDTKLKRDVAIKVLPEAFSSNADRLHRFEMEARAVGGLNHPNIVSVYDLGVENGIHYLVAELLQGRTLREELCSGPLPSRRTIEFAVQVARALAAAHEAGIVHRDLKPENLFITKDGLLKVLDFGLAKQNVSTQDNGTTLAESNYTSPGVVLGTVGYMSPEQVRGSTVDHRTDIFALGAVLYEMLWGRRAFQRSSSAETMTAILREDPPEVSNTAERQVSPALERVMRRCLEKDPAQRFQSAKDVGFALESISAATVETRALRSIPTTLNRWKVAAAAFAVLFAIASSVAVYSHLHRPPLPDYRQLTFQRGFLSAARFAPDGQTVVYSASWNKPSREIYTSRADGSQQRTLDLPPGDLQAISRSGELAITLRNGNLARAPLDGGAPRELLKNVEAADWSPDGTQLAVSINDAGKSHIEYPLGKSLYETVGWISHLRFSPRGDALAFAEHPLPGDDRGSVVSIDLKGKKRSLTQEWEGLEGLAWSPDGSEIWFTATGDTDWNRDLYAVSQSGSMRRVLRTPAPLYLEDIAPDGRLLLQRQDRRYEVAFARVGEQPRLLSWAAVMTASAISRDGQYALLTDMGSAQNYRVYLAKLDGSPALLLGSGTAGGISPDNKWVTSVLPNDTTKVLLLPTGVGNTKTVTTPNFHYQHATWSSDGNSLVVLGSESNRPRRFWTQKIDGSSPRAITPEGVPGRLVAINHSDYICVPDETGGSQLFPIEGGTPRHVTALTLGDAVIGGSENSDVLYVTQRVSGVPREVTKVDLASGRRQPLVMVSPTEGAGVTFVSAPIFSFDEKLYVFEQTRHISVLYLSAGLK